MAHLWKKARAVVFIMLGVYAVSFGAGFAAGKLGWTDAEKVRSSALAALSWDLENKVPVYGALLRAYKAWERPLLMRSIFQGKVVRAMFIIFLNNWVVADLTMNIRAGLIFPMVLYPVGRFAQGVAMARSPAPLQTWMVWLTEFGGYFLTMTASLIAVLWTAFYRRFGFPSRRKALGRGAIVLGLAYLVSGVFFFVGSYAETMLLLGRSLR
jgi:hypothetical protein